MDLRLGQLIYTSFADVGLKVLRSDATSEEIEQVFLQRIAFRYWNSYNPPIPGYRAAYLLQLAPDRTLFGWLYNDKCDDLGRSHLPYFISYYLEKLVSNSQLEILLLCLQKGPACGVSPLNPAATLQDLEITDFSYQSFRPGVAVPTKVRHYSYTALRNKQLLDLYIPDRETQQKIVANGHKGSVFTSATGVNPVHNGAKSKLKQPGPSRASSAAASATGPSSLLPAKMKTGYQIQILLGVGIATTTLALVGLVYSFFQVSVLAPQKPERQPFSWKLSSLIATCLPSLTQSGYLSTKVLSATEVGQNSIVISL
ncbi:MAG: hypothetical protein ACFB4I_08290 [Cyanophyceae cyanobacterium]